MKKLFIVLTVLFSIFGCQQPESEKNRISLVTCSIIKETRGMDSAVRVRELNDARQKLNKPPYLDGDTGIIEALKYDLCDKLVQYSDSYNVLLENAKRIEEERNELIEKQRIKREEELLLAMSRTTGRKVYSSACSACHSSGVLGAPKPSDKKEWQRRVDEKGLSKLIKNAVNGINAMPPMGACGKCNVKDIELTVKYMAGIE